jgi:peptidoglycan/xylan/chitin deacetylase (PgdA/CDA1 family)
VGFALLLLALAPGVAAAGDPAPDADLAADPVVGGAEHVDGDEAPGMVAFTFDDGPQIGTTEKILAALVEYDVPAAFFVVGKHLDPKRRRNAVKASKLLKKIASMGFLVGNHTYGHAHVTTLDKKKLAWQIDHTTKQIRAATGTSIGLFRPPYGGLNDKTDDFLAARGLTAVKWNLDSRDWEGATASEMEEKSLADIRRKNGGVILFHDTKKVTAKTIAKILDDLEEYNCKRLDAGKSIIQPVSLHYFLRDGGKPRKVPPEVEKRTQAYKDGLPDRCDARKAAHR